MEAHLTSLSERKLKVSEAPENIGPSPVRSSKRRVLVVICAYNETRFLRELLEALGQIDVLVVDDGSSDGTGRLAAMEGAVVLTHWKRMGKAASLQDAIDYALDNGYGIVLEMGADSLPEKGVIERLIRSLDPAGVGGASVRQVPMGRKNLSYRVDELIWSVLFHGKCIQMARHGSAHLGGVMYAFKPECVSSVEGSVNDDEHLSVCIKINGYKSLFIPDALVYFDASSSVGHILQRRRRMYLGHMMYSKSTAPSMDIKVAAAALLRSLAEKPSRMACVLPAVFLDLLSRFGAWHDVRQPDKRMQYKTWVTSFEKNVVSDCVRGCQ